MQQFDVFVIGTGVGGSAIANKCASKGLSVGITDELPYGGTCPLRGCDPKIVLIGATEVVDLARRLQGKGINEIPAINWSDLMKFKQSFVDPKPSDIEEGFKKKGISTFHSSAKFISENKLEVGEEIIEANKIVIATGALPHDLNIPGKEYALTSTDFLNLKELPGSLIFIGGGYIAFELAQLAARCGSGVTIVHRGKSALEKFEQDLVTHLIAATRALGINVILETEVVEIRKEKNQFIVTGNRNGQPAIFTSDAVFNSSGRAPNFIGLELGAANVAYGKKGIKVNDYLQSVSNPRIYAVGDCADSPGLPLTPIAAMEGHIAASNIITNNTKKINYPPMPTVVFTKPAMASVGLTEQDAKRQHLSFRVNYKPIPDWFNAKRLNEKEYAFKIIIDEKSEKILGAHLIGPFADETINLFAMAMKAGINAMDIKKMVFSFPTLASDISSMV